MKRSDLIAGKALDISERYQFEVGSPVGRLDGSRMGLSKRMIHCVVNGSIKLGIHAQEYSFSSQPLLHLVQFEHPENGAPLFLLPAVSVRDRPSRPSALKTAAMLEDASAVLAHCHLAVVDLVIPTMRAALG